MTLVAHFPLQDPPGSTATDVEGNNDGSVNGPDQGVAGLLGSPAYQFDGNNDYIEANSISTATWTVAGWIYPFEDLTATAKQTLTATHWEGGVGNANNYLIWVNSTGTLEGRFRDKANSVARTVNYSFAAAEIPQNDWTHVAFSFGDDLVMRLYIDGIQVATNDLGGTGATPKTASFPTQIGVRALGGNGATGWFKGKQAGIRIYDHALSGAGIQHLYHAGTQAGHLSTDGRQL